MSDSVLKRFSSLKISCRSKWRRLSCFSKSFTVPNVQVFVWMCSCEDPCHTPASFIDHPRINDYMSAESIQKSWMEEPLSDLPMSDSLSFSASLSSHHSPHKLDRKHWFLMLKSLPHTHTHTQHSRTAYTLTHMYFQSSLPVWLTVACGLDWRQWLQVPDSLSECVCVYSHAYVYVLSCPHLLPIHSAKEYERETETEKKRVCSPDWVMGVLWKDSRPLSFIFIHSPSPSSPSAATSPATTPPTTTAHPIPPPRASLCAQREALLSSHACLLFPPGPPLVLLGEQLTAGCVWDPAEQTHTRSEQDKRGRRTHLTPPWCPPRSLLEWFLVSGACVCGGQVYLVFWWKCLFVLYVISWMVSICQLHQCNIIMSQKQILVLSSAV